MTKRRAPLIGLAVAAVVVLTSASSCDKINEPYKDAPRSGVQNARPADTITMPDGFSNLATKCDHGNRIYVAFHGNGAYGSITVVPNDQTCAGGPR